MPSFPSVTYYLLPVTCSVVAALILLLAAAAPSFADRADVMVRPEADVTGIQVTVAAIGSVSGTDQALVKKIEAIIICPSPLPGKARKLTRGQIAVALRRGGVIDSSINLLCPESVAVTRTSNRVTGQKIFETIQQQVLSGTWNGQVTVEPVRLPTDVVAPAGEIEVRPKSEKFRRGRNTVAVDIVVDGKVFTTTHLSFLVRVMGPVLVAGKTIAKSEEITGANTVIETRDLTNLPDEIVTEVPAAGVIAASAIAEGAVIRRNWVSEPPVIHRGDAVAVVVKGKFITLSDKGTAAADGKIGDRIKIRMKGDVREVRGTVAGPGIVEVHLRRSL